MNYVIHIQTHRPSTYGTRSFFSASAKPATHHVSYAWSIIACIITITKPHEYCLLYSILCLRCVRYLYKLHIVMRPHTVKLPYLLHPGGETKPHSSIDWLLGLSSSKKSKPAMTNRAYIHISNIYRCIHRQTTINRHDASVTTRHALSALSYSNL